MKKISAIVCIVLLAVQAASAVTVAELSPAQRDRLAQHDIVVLDTLPPGDPAAAGQGGTAVALVRATLEAVWQVLVDYPGHRGLYPSVVDATVLETSANHALVKYVVGVGPFSFGFHVDNYADRDRGRLGWRLAHDRHNDLFRDNWGYWQVEPTSGGVVLTYAMAARTVLPGFLTRSAERQGLIATVRAVRDRAEQSR